MFCKACGNQIPDGKAFCDSCGARVGGPAAEGPPPPLPPLPPPPPLPRSGPTGAPASYGGYGTGGPLVYGAPGAPGKKSRVGLWVGIAAAAVIIIGAGVAVPLLLLDKDHAGTTTLTTVVSKTSTTRVPSTSVSSVVSSTSTSGTTTTTGVPGDSGGRWVETEIPETPEGAYGVSVSDQALLVETHTDSGFGLYAYLPGSDSYVALPVEGTAFLGADLDGLLAVWREGTSDEATGKYVDTYICAYLLPNGPKVEVVREAQAVAYPQVAGRWVSWTEQTPSDFNPEEYWDQHIYVVEVDAKGEPVGEPTELVSSAPADVLGDSTWFYSLSSTHMAWENAVGHHLTDAGTYVMELSSEAEPQKVGNEAWRPSIGGNTIVYWDSGLKAADLATGQVRELDSQGDYATAAPTYAAYFRTVESGDTVNYDIVARGFTGDYEQVLATTTLEPYMSPAIAASAHRVAFIVDDAVHLFEWQGE